MFCQRVFCFLLLVFSTLFSSALSAQGVKNVSVWHRMDTVFVSYDLAGDHAYYIECQYKSDSFAEWTSTGKRCSGDVGYYVEPGMKKMFHWHVQEKGLSPGKVGFEIRLRSKPFLEMVKVNGGTFKMGCTEEQRRCDKDERPVHRVTLDAYYMSKYEITNAQYSVFLNNIKINRHGIHDGVSYIHISNSHCQIRYRNGKFEPNKGKGDMPVVEVTWNGASAFCRWAEGRLPTEAEWEFAARGGRNGKDYLYSGSDTLNKVAWFDENSNGHAHAVGTKQGNELGIHDMSGNVWEWCFDWYSKYTASHKKNPKGPRSWHSVVVRGGSWLYYGLFCRVANRGSAAPSLAFNNYGFRMVRTID